MGVPVPPLVARRVLQPEVAADVDDPAAVLEPLRCLLRGLPGRERGEHDIGIGHVATHDEVVGRVVEVREDGTEHLALP